MASRRDPSDVRLTASAYPATRGVAIGSFLPQIRHRLLRPIPDGEITPRAIRAKESSFPAFMDFSLLPDIVERASGRTDRRVGWRRRSRGFVPHLIRRCRVSSAWNE